MKINVSKILAIRDPDKRECAAKELKEAVAEAQVRARVRTITWENIVVAVDVINRRLHIPAYRMDGIVAHVDYHAQKFPNAYNGIPMSTQFALENHHGVWYITDIRRARCCRPTKSVQLNLPECAQQAVIDHLLSFKW